MKCVVLAGAGASVAVDPDTYPSTLDFFKRLPSTITDDDLFKRLLEFLNEKEDGEQIDIELVLWSLGELADALTALRNSQHPIGWFLQGTRLPQPRKALRRPFHVEALREIVKVSAPRVAKLVSDINRQVYELYQPLPGLEALRGTWLPMLKLLREFKGVQLYTTNYDLVIEEALSQLGAGDTFVDTGWRGSTKRTLHTQLWGTGPVFSQPLLTKLHGSVNWSWVADEIHISDPAYKGDHKRHPILYPGFKGRPAQEPFSSFHRHLQHALRQADVVIVIGFAFRDEHINQLFDDEVGPRTAVYVIDIRNPEGMPVPGDRLEVIGEGKGFTAAVVEELGKRLETTAGRRTPIATGD